MKKIKIIVCIVANIALFSLAAAGYTNVSRNTEIVTEQNPVEVKILDLTYRAKSASTCKVEYQNKIYDAISLPKGVKVGNVNDKDFYYDAEKDVVFYKDENIGALYIVSGLAFLSLLLWFVPKEKFKW